MVIVALYFEVCDCASTKQSKYSNCTVNPSKYLEENQEIRFHFHHHCQVRLIYYFDQDCMPLFLHVIQFRIRSDLKLICSTVLKISNTLLL